MVKTATGVIEVWLKSFILKFGFFGFKVPSVEFGPGKISHIAILVEAKACLSKPFSAAAEFAKVNRSTGEVLGNILIFLTA